MNMWIFLIHYHLNCYLWDFNTDASVAACLLRSRKETVEFWTHLRITTLNKENYTKLSLTTEKEKDRDQQRCHGTRKAGRGPILRVSRTDPTVPKDVCVGRPHEWIIADPPLEWFPLWKDANYLYEKNGRRYYIVV